MLLHATRTAACGSLSSRRQAPITRLHAQAVVSQYTPPSSANATSELDSLKRVSCVVPDSNESLQAVSNEGGKKLFGAMAATVSAGTVASLVAGGALGLRPYQNAVNAAMSFDRCKSLPTEAERGQCKLDKAVVNVGTLFSKEVDGRVCTQVDPRLHNNTEALVTRVQTLADMYKENGVQKDKLLFRLPATWAGIQAAKQCEAKGIATQVFLVHSLAQAVAAAQAGVSVIQLSVGRVREWYLRYPNALRDPRAPRQDAGGAHSGDPGVALVEQVFNYVKKYHPKTKILVTGLRNRDDVMACSGADFLLIPSKVLTQLALTPTFSGYNDGLSATKSVDEEGIPALSVNAAEKTDIEKMGPFTEDTFTGGMDMMASELLKQGLQQQVAEAERLLPVLERGTYVASF